MLINLGFANNTILSCFFLFFLIIDLYFLIPAVTAKIFNPIAGLLIPIVIPSKQAKVEMKTHPVFYTYRIQAYDSIMCGYFCIGFIDFMLKGKSLLEYTNLFSPNEYKKNDRIILTYFQQNLSKLKCIVMFAIIIGKIKN